MQYGEHIDQNFFAVNVVFSATPSNFALSAAKGAVDGVHPDMIYVDVSTATPNEKKQIGNMVEAKGGLFVDGTMMVALLIESLQTAQKLGAVLHAARREHEMLNVEDFLKSEELPYTMTEATRQKLQWLNKNDVKSRFEGGVPRNWKKALISTCLGVLISTIGLDYMSGAERFTFGNNWLADGIDFVSDFRINLIPTHNKLSCSLSLKSSWGRNNLGRIYLALLPNTK